MEVSGPKTTDQPHPMNNQTPQTGRRWYVAGAFALLVAAGIILVSHISATPDAAKSGTTSPTVATTPVAERKAVVSAEAQPLLDQMRTAYQAIKSAEFAGAASSNIDADGEEQKTATKFTSSFEAPNKFRHQGEEDLAAGSTGEKVFVYNGTANEYLLVDAPKEGGVDQLPNVVPELLQAQNPSLLFVLLGDATSAFTRTFEKISRGPDVEIDGKKHPALVFEPPQNHGTVTVVLDADTHLLKRFRVDLKSALEQRGAKDVKVAEVVVDYSQIKTGLDFPETHFAWTPPENAQDVAAARVPAEEEAEKALVGKPAPDFQLKTLDGKSVSLAELKGQVVVLDFWASWCPPCIESLPHLGKLYQEKQGKGVKVFAVNVAEDKAKVETFLKSKNVTVPVLLDSKGDAAKKYNVTSLPQTVIIGKDGTVKKVFVGLGADSFEQIRNEIAREGEAS